MATADPNRRARAEALLDAKPTRNAPQTRREMVEDAYRQGVQAEQRQGKLWYIGDRNVTTTEADYLNYLHASAGSMRRGLRRQRGLLRPLPHPHPAQPGKLQGQRPPQRPARCAR
jgi:hypothetical protein